MTKLTDRLKLSIKVTENLLFYNFAARSILLKPFVVELW